MATVSAGRGVGGDLVAGGDAAAGLGGDGVGLGAAAGLGGLPVDVGDDGGGQPIVGLVVAADDVGVSVGGTGGAGELGGLHGLGGHPGGHGSASRLPPRDG